MIHSTISKQQAQIFLKYSVYKYFQIKHLKHTCACKRTHSTNRIVTNIIQITQNYRYIKIYKIIFKTVTVHKNVTGSKETTK